jgi:hypothetical protein
MISVTASKTTIQPGEIVRFTGYADPVEDINLDAYVGGVKVAEYTIYLKTLGINYIDIKPSLLGDVVVFYPYGATSGATASPITITTVVSPPAAYSLTLSASKTRDINPGEIVTFTVTSSPPANLRATLYAYVGGVLVAEYGVSIVNGVGKETLVPSELGSRVDWQAEDEYGDRSNIVTTEIKTAPPAAYSLTLSASKTRDIERDEVVTFTLRVSPSVTYVATLYAYVEGREVGRWNMNVVDGAASISLVPSLLGSSVDWYAVDAYGNKSNTVTTTLKGAAPPISWAVPLLIIGGLIVLAEEAKKR